MGRFAPDPIKVVSLTLVCLLTLLIASGGWAGSQVAAQENSTPSQEPLQAPPATLAAANPIQQVQATSAPIQISGLDPASIPAGQGAVLSITGANFTPSTTIQLIGFGSLPATFINATLIRVTLPATLPANRYFVQATDPVGGSTTSPTPFTVLAPTATNMPTLAPAITVSRSEPGQAISGQVAQISVFGANFTQNSTVHIIGVGFLPTTFVNSTVLTASLPDNMNAGQYTIEVTDPAGGTAISPSPLTVIGPSPFPPTQAPLPTETLVPTPVPGQPSLFVRAFTVSPGTISPGDTTTLTFEVVNQGNYEAWGVAVSVDTGSKFIPANGQASAILPNMAPGGVRRVTLKVVAAADATAGPNSIPLTLTYSDLDAKTYTSKANLSVTIRKTNESPQVLLVHYSADPSPVSAGKPIRLKVELANLGNEPAFQVLVRIPDKTTVLLPGDQGDSFSAGTLNANGKATLDLPLVVVSDAKAGFQTQPLVISYLLDGKVVETTSSITIDVARSNVEDPLLVLASYETGVDVLKPGDTFQLKAQLQNIGKGNAENLLVSFGAIQTAADTSSNNNGSSTPESSGGSALSASPGDTFAPLKTGGTILVGSLDGNGAQVTVTQDFIVNARVTSGVYSLPITLRYQRADGTVINSSLRASLVVVTPPQVQMTLQNPIAQTVNVGDVVPISVKISNLGSVKVNLTTFTAQADNAQVSDGAESAVKPLDPSSDVTVAATVNVISEGTIKITLTLHYLDDLNREQTITKSYETQAVIPPPPPTFAPVTPSPVVEVQSSPQDFWQRLLFGLLGLGS